MRAAGFDFVGTEPEFTGYPVQVELDDPDRLEPGRHDTPTGMYTMQKPGTIAMVDLDGGACHRVRPVTRDHVQAVLRRVSGVDVTVTALELATTWTDRARQATTYRHGRVLLAGDAAHIHSPLGGQGLGLGDAIDLGWKLAATVRGDAPADLLERYTRERHPVGAMVLDWSRAQVALMRPSPSTRALAAIVRDLIDTSERRARAAGWNRRVDRGWGRPRRCGRSRRHAMVRRGCVASRPADPCGSTSLLGPVDPRAATRPLAAANVVADGGATVVRTGSIRRCHVDPGL